MAKSDSQASPTQPELPIFRFAHPFFTNVPPEDRQPGPGGFRRMTEFTEADLEVIPPPYRSPRMMLEEVIGADGVQEITALGTIRFQATGDTGRRDNSDRQEEVSDAMSAEFDPAAGGRNPAFFLHLGDVIYGPGKQNAYRDEFYRPYKNYPGKILAVAGNHDGETFPGTDPKTLAAFLENFCGNQNDIPAVAAEVRIFRQRMTQPGVYWLLDAPFLHLIGLYSNIGEGPGFLTGKHGDRQQLDWLQSVLADIAMERKNGVRKALVIAVHHPPFSNGGHAGSPKLLAELDRICQIVGILPDALLSGHSHTYQHHTRHWRLNGQVHPVPFVVAGCGGHGLQNVGNAHGQTIQDHTFEKSLKAYGYLSIEASFSALTIEMRQVDGENVFLFDSITVQLQQHSVAHLAPTHDQPLLPLLLSPESPNLALAAKPTPRLPTNQFGALTGQFDHWTLSPHDGPHDDDNHIYLWIQIASGSLAGKYEVAVNVRSNDPIHHPNAADQLNLRFSLHSQPTALTSWPIPGFDSQAKLSFTEIGLNETQFKIVESGELRSLITQYATTCQRISVFGVTYSGGDGLHDVHMNSGNRPPRQHENLDREDGALVFYFDGEHGGPIAHWLFLKFKTQDFPK